MKEDRFPTPTDLESDVSDFMSDILSEGSSDFHFDDDLDLAELDALLSENSSETEGTAHSNSKRQNGASSSTPAAGNQTQKKSSKQKSKSKSKAAEKSNFVQKAIPYIGKDKKRAILFSGAAVGVLLICVVLGILIGGAMDPFDNRILQDTTIGGIPVGGMTRLEAYRTLNAATKSTFSQQTMEVSLPNGTISLSPSDTGAKLKTWSAASAAFHLGRKGSEAERQSAVEASENGGNSVDMLPYLKIDQDFIRSQLEAYAAEHNVTHTELSYHLVGEQPALEENLYSESAPTQTLELTMGTPLEELDVDSVLSDILYAYGHNTFNVNIDSIAHQTTPIAPDLEAMYEEFYIAPVNTTLDMDTYQQVPGSYGYQLDMDQAKKLVASAQYGETVSIPLVCVKPEILGDEAYFQEELGYCETKHTNNEDRNTNLRLACEALDGLILQPGEEFSYNDTLGERTKEKGYKPAAAYSGVNTVNSIGGGVCQVSTTLYNAALLADMEIVFRVNHGFRSSYIGVGLDATVNWGGPDFQFRNNSHFPVMIKAEVSDGYVKVKLLGTDEKDYYIKMTSGYSEDEDYVYSWSYKNKYDKETDELISKEREAYSCYMK